MGNFKVGIFLDCLRLGFDAGLKKAKEIGASGFQLNYNEKEAADPALIADKRARIAAAGFEVSAICTGVDVDDNDEQNEKMVAEVEKVAAFTEAFGSHVITGHIGVIPDKKATEHYRRMLKVMTGIGHACAAHGCTFAIETGPENTCILGEFLDQIPEGVGVNFDPANVVMAQFSENGADAVAPVAKYIVHTHAKDGINENGHGKEVPLGEGWVDFKAYLEALAKGGFSGYLTIERECGADPVGDTAKAIEFLCALPGVE